MSTVPAADVKVEISGAADYNMFIVNLQVHI